MARYESLHGNHNDEEEEEDHVTQNEVGDHDEDDEQRHTESLRSSKSSYTAVEQDDEEGNAASRAVYAALYGGGGGSPPSGGPVHVSGDRQTGTGDDHHHQLNTPPPVLQHPGPFDAPLIPPKSPARSTNNNPFLSNVNVPDNTTTTTTTSTPTSNQQATDHQTHGSGSSRNASGEPGTTSRSASRDSTNYVNQYSRSWKPGYGLPHSRDHHHHHPGHSPFSPLPETAEVEGDYHHQHHHGHHKDDHHDYHDHDHDSSDDPHDLDQDDYIMYEKETGGMATTPRSTTTGRGGPGTGSFKEKGGKGGGKGGMRKLMLVERTDTKRGRGGGRGRRGTEMSEVSIDATDSISVRGLPTHGSGGGSGSGSPSALTPGVVGGGMNRSEQHLSYFHFDSTETLVQSKQSMLGWWLEGLGVLGGLLCIVVIGLVLSIYDRKPPPSTWPGGLNLNVFLSFMTTLATACYMIPVIEGLGQLRWLRYTGGRQTVSRPASDFEAIDQASRGLHHCWKLLGFQGGPLGILASLITFLTLFTPSLTQLLITYLPPQPHRNNPGEPFDSNRSAVTLVRINWSWLAFLLVQVLLSATFLTTIIVKTRMEGIQIFKTSALPGMTALDGQARSSLGGAMMGQGGIMTSAALGERAKKTTLKLERSSGATGGGGNYGLVQGFVVDSSAGSNSGSHGSGSGSGSGSAGMGLRMPKGLGLGLGLERFRHHDHQVLPSYDKEGGGEGYGVHQGFGNGPAENLSFPAAAAAAAGFTPLPMPMSKAKPMPISTTLPASTALSGRRRMRFSLFGGAGREKLKMRGSPVHASNGGGQF